MPHKRLDKRGGRENANGSQKLPKFNIHRQHYSPPTSCKTGKKLEFRKLSFQKMFCKECNFKIYFHKN